MSKMIFESSDYQKTLFDSLLDARNTHGFMHKIADDIQRKPLNYGMFTLKAFALGKILSRKSSYGKNVGILLPNTVVTLLAFYGLQAFGRVPAMLNFSTGAANLLHSCKIAEVKTIITSHKFITTANLEHLIQAAENHNIKIIFLEDLARNLNIIAKIFGLIGAILPRTTFEIVQRIEEIRNEIDYKNSEYNRYEKPAVILFTSGSEGQPKGVVLSHSNLLSNCYQILSILDLNPTDNIFNVLPMFHSFGLTGGAILPIMSGISVFEYPSPLHYRVVPELIYDTDTTIFFATDTFLANYAKYAHPYDFYSIKYIISGAEKLKDETRKVWGDKFGVRIFEGYGCTETSPGVAINTPMHFRIGTVGRILPGMKTLVEKVEGVEDAGRLLVSGPNIMLGYLNSDGVLKFPEYQFKDPELAEKHNGQKWYDTGDIVNIDNDGYIKIVDRLKRFAKVGGEMISLLAVEGYIDEILQLKEEDKGLKNKATQNAIIAINDDKKGEQLVLVTNVPGAERSTLANHFKDRSYPEIAIPKNIIYMEDLPLLGSGKTDYVKLKQLVLEII
jgi:acyl-[acyl-carrier-protein]-phospholipid O-acyltransferase/long-chain-fatty-acid--[acyl-carrier-protein] ligase